MEGLSEPIPSLRVGPFQASEDLNSVSIRICNSVQRICNSVYSKSVSLNRFPKGIRLKKRLYPVNMPTFGQRRPDARHDVGPMSTDVGPISGGRRVCRCREVPSFRGKERGQIAKSYCNVTILCITRLNTIALIRTYAGNAR